MMRKISFKITAIALASVALVFAGCSKENGSTTRIPDGKPACITLSVKGNGSVSEKASATGNAYVGSRSIDGDQVTMKDFTVFILGDGGVILGKKYIDGTNFDSADPSVGDGNFEIPTTTSARHIYVVGNTGSDMTVGSGLFGTGVTTLAKLQTAYFKFEDIKKDALWIEGHTTEQLNFVAGAATDGSPLATAANIQMNLIPARVDVYVNNNMKNYGESGSMILDNISFLNSAGYASPVPYNPTVDPAVTPYSYAPADDIPALALYYRSGIIDYQSLIPYLGVVAQSDDLIFDWSGGNFEPTGATPTEPVGFLEACSKTFYALPGGIRTKIVTVVATLANGTDKVYFPVHFGTSDTNFEEFESGKRYVMTINLNGDATLGGGGGTDPEKPVESAFVTVTVKAAKWDPVPLPAKNFN